MLGKKKKPVSVPIIPIESLLSQITVIEQELHHITMTSASKRRVETACTTMRGLIQPEEAKS
jgi:hypothetical protein